MSAVRRPHRSTLVLLVAVALLAVGAAIAYFSPLLVVRGVTVTGHRHVSTEEVIAAASVPMGTPLARQDVQAIAERATQIPAVRAASVTRKWPSTLAITVTERRAVLAVRSPAGFVLVDGEGVAFGREVSVPMNAVPAEVNPGDRRLLLEAGTVASALPAELSREVRVLTATGPDRISLRLSSGVTVNWGSATDSPLKAQIVLALLEGKPRTTIDVSSPNNPAVR